MASPGEVAVALTSWATRGVVKSSASTHNDVLFTLGDTTSGVDGAPSALFSVTCTSAVCQFSEKATDADGALTKWQWDFGDGMSSASRNPSHDFVWNGTYRVTLVVTDDKGNTGAYAAPVIPASAGLSVRSSTSRTSVNATISSASLARVAAK